MIKKLCVLTLILTCQTQAVVHATDLMDVYLQALDNDTTFKSAYSSFMASTEAIPQARSALLPQLKLRGQYSANQQNVTAGDFTIKEPYRNQQLQIAASQPIFNIQAWSQLKQAKAGVKAAHATFNDAAQALILRVTTAYLNILYAQDNLNFANAKKRANKRQLDQATQRFNVGLEPMTSIYNAQSAYDQSVSDVIFAENNIVTQNEKLRELTNVVYEHLSSLKQQKIPLISPEPSHVEDWIATSLRQNYKLLAAKFKLQSARENIKVKNAGNWPVFQLEGNSTNIKNVNSSGFSNVPNSPISSGSGGNFFIPSVQQISNIAVTVNFPVFQGGLVQSQTRQAQYDFQTSSEQMEHVYRSIVVSTRITYNSVISGINKITADRKTLLSQEKTVESTEAQFLVGTRTMVDVVNAQQHLFEAQLQLAKDQYHYMNNILSLKYYAGTLNVNDLAELNAWLSTHQ